VTASKRQQKLQDVPAAITAVRGETIENLGITSFRDYASLVPGLTQRDSGQPGVGTVILRGLNSGAQQTTATAGFYIDDSPFSSSGYLGVSALTTPEPELAEVERIEVLKGPQGTLYGAGSLGGLIRIVTKKPDTNRFFGSVRGEVSQVDSGETGFLVRGSVNVPIATDVAAVSVTGYYRRLPGFVDNVGTGTADVNRSNIAGGRVALLVEPAPGFRINVSGMYQDIDNFGAAGIATLPGTFTPRYGGYSYSAFKNFGGWARYRLANTTVEYDTGIGTVTASGSYAKYDVSYSGEVTNTYIPAGRATLAPIAVATFGVPVDTLLPANSLAASFFNPAADKWSAEVRFASKRLGPVEFLAGAFYTKEDSTYAADIFPYTAAGVPFAAPYNYLIHTTTTSKYEEIAAFGNLTFYISDNLDVTGGLRYAHNDQVSGTGGQNSKTYFLPRAALTFPIKDDATTYLGAIRWRPASNISVYARAASGYRPGGPQTNASPPPGAQTLIRSDTVWNYEVGVKGSTLGGAFTYDISAFHIDWNDIQLNTLSNGFVLGGNAASATVDGFEMQLSARPNSLLTVGASVGHTIAKLGDISAAAAALAGAKAGDALPLTSPWTVALIADHRIPFSETVNGNLGATMRFQSETPSNFPLLNPTGNFKLPAITTVDVRGSVTFNERYTATIRVDNAFNQFGVSNIDASGAAVVIRPRSVSLGLGVKF
jgi:iron complex outermembrane receptor protein